MSKSISRKQELFAQLFIKTGNATQSYIDAGYEKKGANKNAIRLRDNPLIQNYLEKLRKQLEKHTIASIQENQELLTNILRNEEHHLKYRLRAIELLLKTQGAFEYKKELENQPTTVIIQKVI